jgi:KaiC/GvpD/RAD55 family RecA-like ATPase
MGVTADYLSDGGLHKGRRTVLTGTTGTGKTMFSLQFLRNGIVQFQGNGWGVGHSRGKTQGSDR